MNNWSSQPPFSSMPMPEHFPGSSVPQPYPAYAGPPYPSQPPENNGSFPFGFPQPDPQINPSGISASHPIYPAQVTPYLSTPVYQTPLHPGAPPPYAGYFAQGYAAVPSVYPALSTIYPATAVPYPAAAGTHPVPPTGYAQPPIVIESTTVQQQGKVASVKSEPTLRPFPSFDCDRDVKMLYAAMKGLGWTPKKFFGDCRCRTLTSKEAYEMIEQGILAKAVLLLFMPCSGFSESKDPKKFGKLERRTRYMELTGTDEKVIIDILANRTWTQRSQILTTYKSIYRQDLVSRLQSELSGNLEHAVVALMQSPEVFDARSLHEATFGLGTNEETLIEIICSRTNTELAAIKTAYKAIYKQTLEKDVEGDTSGVFRRILFTCMAGTRPEDHCVDATRAKTDAEALLRAGPKRWGTDDSTFTTIFSTRSFAQLYATFTEFQKNAKMDIEKCVADEMNGDAKKTFSALVKIVRNKPGFFAELLYQSMEGPDASHKTLIRLLVTRCETDLGNIKQEFQRMYGVPLAVMLSDKSSGDYKKILLALIK